MTQEITQKKSDPVADFIGTLSGGWAKVLPNVCTPKRFARVAITCMKKNPKLLEAMQTGEGKRSLAEAFMRCAELGIEPDGRRAYLIPYKDNKTKEYTINLIFDYKGIVELAMRSGMISSIHADKVCENDEFEYNIGEIVKHKIDFRNERGDAYAYYTVVTFKDGTKKTEVMSKFEVEQIKERSSAWASFKKYGKICPWNTDYDEMAKKTVFKRASKWLPLSAEAKQAIDIDNDNETDFPTYTVDNRTPEQMYAPVEDDGIIDAQCAVVEEKAEAVKTLPPAADTAQTRQEQPERMVV